MMENENTCFGNLAENAIGDFKSNNKFFGKKYITPDHFVFDFDLEIVVKQFDEFIDYINTGKE